MAEPIQLVPRVRETVWGGRWLADELHRPGAPGANLGESWEAYSGSEIREGKWQGQTLSDLWTQHKAALFGSAAEPFPQFPLLVKFIDARENLSIQVHPDDALAQKLEDYPFGKTEFWYILQAAPDTEIIYGLASEGVTRETLQAALAVQDVLPHVGRVRVQAGDVVFIPAGTVHAITAGVVVYELQQESDITYRLYDWGRTDREMHLEKGLEAIRTDCHSMSVTRPEMRQEDGFERGLLAECAYFQAHLVRISETAHLASSPESFSLLTVVQGAGTLEVDSLPSAGKQETNSPPAENSETELGRIKMKLQKGDTLFLPAGMNYTLSPLSQEYGFQAVIGTLA